MNNLPTISYQNSVNPPVTLGIPASHFDSMHYLIRIYQDFKGRGDSWTVFRSYVPIGDVMRVESGAYRAKRNGESYDYPSFGEAVADLVVRTS
jgi:hypothetical protein